jgi:hypothetical protein
MSRYICFTKLKHLIFLNGGSSFKCTNPISFVSAPSSFHFRSESAIRYIRSWILNPHRVIIRFILNPTKTHDRGYDKMQNPIRSVYIPTYGLCSRVQSRTCPLLPGHDVSLAWQNGSWQIRSMRRFSLCTLIAECLQCPTVCAFVLFAANKSNSLGVLSVLFLIWILHLSC